MLSSVNNGSCFHGLSRDVSVLVKGAHVTTLLGKMEGMGEAGKLHKKARAASCPEEVVRS